MKTIFSEETLSQIQNAIGKWNLSVKYAYTTPVGQKSWEELETKRNQDASSFSDADIFQRGVDAYLKELGNPEEIDMIDIGWGAWLTSGEMIKILLSKWIHVSYHTIDISEEMIRVCKSNILKLIDEFHGHHFDIESENIGTRIRSMGNKNNPKLICILWSTIWNFPCPSALIERISEWLSRRDRILIWSQEYNLGWQGEIVELYNNSLEAKTLTGATLVALGNRISLDTITFRYCNRTNMIIGEWNHDGKYHCQEDEIVLWKPWKIRIMESRKFRPEDVFQIAWEKRIATIQTHPEIGYFQYMIDPKLRQ